MMFFTKYRYFHIPALLASLGLLIQACSGRIAPVPTSQIPTLQPTVAESWLPVREHTSLSNLLAFARLYGYVRYFHPSDQAASTNWNLAAENGVAAILDAKDPIDLASRLQQFFHPVAPTLIVFLQSETPIIPEIINPPTEKNDVKVVMWQHYGVAGDMVGSPYYSERIEAPALQGKPPIGFHDPQHPFYTELGSGIGAYLPLALFFDEAGTFPHIDTSDQRFIDRPNIHDERITWLSAVIVSWNVLQHFYPYFDFVQVDWFQVLEEVLLSTLEAEDEATFIEGISRMAAQLRDGHARIGLERSYREDYQPDLQLDWIEEQLVVIGAGNWAGISLQPGDIIRSIDGIPAAQVIETAEALISGATPQWIRYRAAREVLRGSAGSSVTIEYLGADGVVREVSLTRNLSPVELEMLRLESRPDLITEIETGIFYVDLNLITERDLTRTLSRLEGASGIIFDMRGYPRTFKPITHLIDHPVIFVHGYVPLVTYPDRLNMDFELSTWELEPDVPRLTANTVFLIDGRAYSAAESFLGIVEHYQLGELVGQTTAGTNGNVNQILLPGGYTLAWTGMKVLKHDGSQHHGVGIQPTEYVNQTIQGIREGRDEQLERALEILKENQ
jgi:hypothetical protein